MTSGKIRSSSVPGRPQKLDILYTLLKKFCSKCISVVACGQTYYCGYYSNCSHIPFEEGYFLRNTK